MIRQSSLGPRQMSSEPVTKPIMGPDGEPHPACFGPKGIEGYTYFVPVPKLDLDLRKLLSSAATQPLVQVFWTNESCIHGNRDDFRFLYQRTSVAVPGRDLGLIPLMADQTRAMMLGSFAYQPDLGTFGQSGKQCSEPLFLLKIHAGNLLNDRPPHQHVLGPVWLESAQSLLDLIEAGQASVVVVQYEVMAKQLGYTESHKNFLLKLQKEKLQNRKRKLEDTNKVLEKRMKYNTKSLANINRMLTQNEPLPIPVPSLYSDSDVEEETEAAVEDEAMAAVEG